MHLSDLGSAVGTDEDSDPEDGEWDAGSDF